MSFKILYKSQHFRFAFTVSKRQLLASVIVVGGIGLMAMYNTQPNEREAAVVAGTQTILQQQQKQVDQLKLATQQQLTGMVMKLGDMQAQLRRLDALGEKLANSAHLSTDEFGFGQEPATGGPSQDAPTFLTKDSKQLVAKMDTMLAQIKDKSRQLDALESILLSHHVNQQRYLTGRPIHSGWLSSFFGIRKDPFTGLPAMHKGLDFAGKKGQPVYSTGAGIVTWAGKRYGYGNLVEINHGNGLSTRYGHNSKVEVKVGDVVTKGQEIALMGSTGRSTGPHVHYEVLRNGRAVDPLAYVSRKNKENWALAQNND